MLLEIDYSLWKTNNPWIIQINHEYHSPISFQSFVINHPPFLLKMFILE